MCVAIGCIHTAVRQDLLSWWACCVAWQWQIDTARHELELYVACCVARQVPVRCGTAGARRRRPARDWYGWAWYWYGKAVHNIQVRKQARLVRWLMCSCPVCPCALAPQNYASIREQQIGGLTQVGAGEGVGSGWVQERVGCDVCDMWVGLRGWVVAVVFATGPASQHRGHAQRPALPSPALPRGPLPVYPVCNDFVCSFQCILYRFSKHPCNPHPLLLATPSLLK